MACLTECILKLQGGGRELRRTWGPPGHHRVKGKGICEGEEGSEKGMEDLLHISPSGDRDPLREGTSKTL